MLLGDWSGTKVPASFGIEGIPSIWLIGTDGLVMAKDLRGESIRNTVEAALGKRSERP